MKKRKADLGCALACLGGIVSLAFFWSVAAAYDATNGLRLVWSFAHQGIARFCYDKTPAVIYLKYEIARNTTLILTRNLEGDENIVGEFPGSPDERSLSCSQDGKTIVALGDGEIKSLFISKEARSSLYMFRHTWMFSNEGLYSLISPDGTIVTLPEAPTLVHGDDLLKDMKVFPYQGHSVFFMADYAYLDKDGIIDQIVYVDGEWKSKKKFKLPRMYNLSEVSRCGDRDVARLIGVDSSKYAVFSENALSEQEFLKISDVKQLFHKYIVPDYINGIYDSCVFTLRKRNKPSFAAGLARVDANGIQIFSFMHTDAELSDYEAYFSKDGCYALIHASGPTPVAPLFAVRPEVQLLRVQSPQCR